MKVAGILPVKPIADSKTRLSGVLDDDQREELSKAMFLHALHVFFRLRRSVQLFVISSDGWVLKTAAHNHASPVKESSPTGVNPAVVKCLRLIKKSNERFSYFLVIPADLPILTPREVELAIELAKKGSGESMVITPSLRLDGTNLLLISLMRRFSFSYDNDSFANHIAFGEHNGLQVKVLLSKGLMSDVDRREDLVIISKFGMLPTVAPSSKRVAS